MSDAPPPMRLAVSLLTVAGVAALAISLYLLFGGREDATVGPSTYSRSAIGHDVVLELLQKTGIDAQPSRGASVQKVRHGGLLVIAEPNFEAGGKTAMQRLLAARSVLLVLPKWDGAADSARHGWLGVAAPLPPLLPQAVLDDAALDATVVRPTKPPRLMVNRLGPAAHLTDPPQLMHATSLEPLVAGPDGVLIGRQTIGTHELFVLADPDVISNHGMAEGNAPLAVALIERARHGGPVIFDETIHGFTTVPANRLRLLFARPFLAATLDMLLACGLLIWAGWLRFGTVLPRPALLRPGTLALIDNITDLLLDTGQNADLLRRYVMATIDDVATRLHAPQAGDGRAAWLARAEQHRGMTLHAATLSEAARVLVGEKRNNPARQVALAGDAFAWKQEILDAAAGTGPRGGRDPRGNPQGGGRAG